MAALKYTNTTDGIKKYNKIYDILTYNFMVIYPMQKRKKIKSSNIDLYTYISHYAKINVNRRCV